MKIIRATTAHKMTIDAIKAKRDRILDKMSTRITTNISLGKFECEFLIDPPMVLDELSDYFTSLGYAVHFSPVSNSDSYIMTVSWENATL